MSLLYLIKSIQIIENLALFTSDNFGNYFFNFDSSLQEDSNSSLDFLGKNLRFFPKYTMILSANLGIMNETIYEGIEINLSF